jgi:hypothetical protein
MIGTTTTSTSGYLGTINGGTGAFFSPGVSIYDSSSNILGISPPPTNSKNMTPKQVQVAVFTITRDKNTNEINSTKFWKELWVEQKNGASIDLIVAKQLDKDFDPEFTIIKVLSTVSF